MMKSLFNIFVSVFINKRNKSSVVIPTGLERYTKKQKRKTFNKDLFSERKKKILKSLLSSDVSEFLNVDQLSELNPFLRVKSSATTKYSFVIESKTAKNIAEKIIPHLLNKNTNVLEQNPGLGLISLNLIQLGLPKIYIFENKNLRTMSVNNIMNKYHSRVLIIQSNLYNQLFYKNMSLSDVIGCGGKGFKIVGVITNYSFFSKLIYTIVSRNLWDVVSLMEFYVVISLDLYNKILTFKSHKGKYFIYCMFNFIFNAEVMEEYPREAFLPFSNVYNDKMFLIKITKKQDNFSVIDENSITAYIALLKILGRSRHNFVIPTLEKWLPGCGPLLISKGISLTTKTQDITAAESVKLFNLIKTFGGYKNFQFLVKGFDVDTED